MSESNNKLFVSENGVVSLEVEEDYDLDLAMRLFIKSNNNLKLEIKYPNLNKLDSSMLDDKNYLKTLLLPIRPIEIDKSQSKAHVCLCESILGLYANLGYDSLSKNYKIIVQGFVPNKPLSKQSEIKLGKKIKISKYLKSIFGCRLMNENNII